MSESWDDLKAAPAAPESWSDLKATPESWSDLKAPPPEMPTLTGMVQRIGAAFPKGNPNSSLSAAIEAHGRGAGQQFGEGFQQVLGMGDYARGGVNDSDPLTNLGNLPMGAFKMMSGMFSGATALPQAITDVSVGNALAKATENAPHGSWYDLRMSGTFLGDLGANTLGWLAGGPHISAELAARTDARLWAQHGAEAQAARDAYTPPPAAAPPKAPTAILTPADLWARQQHAESGGDQSAVSPKGARGVSQLMPTTAAQVAAQVGRPELADLAMQDSTEGRAANDYLGRVYMGQQLDTFHDPAVALAAYNAGPARAAEWISRFGSPDAIGRGKWIDMIPFKETRDYVRKILGDAAPAEMDLAPHEAEASTQAMRSHLSDGGYLPTQRDLIQTAADEAAAAHGLPPANPEILPEKNALPPQKENWADLQGEAMPPDAAAAADEQAQLRGNLWRLPRDQLEQLHAEGQTSDWDNLVKAFGSEDEARAFNNLEKRRHSIDVRVSDEASAEFDRRYGNLTPDQERLVYGIGETGPQLDDLKDILKEHQEADDLPHLTDNQLYAAMGYAMRDLRSPDRLREVQAGTARPNVQAQAMRFMSTLRELEGRGLKLDQAGLSSLVEQLVRHGYGKFSDVAEVIGSFVDEAKAMRGEAPEPAPPALEHQPVLDLTDQALNHMRAGTKPKLNEGPSLLEGLAKEGGVRDEGGELSAMDMGRGDRLAKMAFRKKSGMSLTDAVEWAQTNGYLPRDVYDEHAPTDSTGSDALVEAIRRELSGERVYPPERVNHEGRLVQEHMGDLDEFMHQLGVDPSTHTNAQIKAAMDGYFKGASEPESILASRASPADAAIRNAQAERAARIQARDAVYASTRGELRFERQGQAVPEGGAPIDLAGTRASIWRGLAQAMDVPVRQGRLSLKKVLGTYDRKSGMVRVKSAHDVGVESHELAHAMEFTKKYPSLLAEMVKFEKALKANDYDPLAQRRHEGFAEWMRTYVTNPDIARQIAPGFYDAFEKAMATDDPKVAQALKSAQQQYSDLLAAPSIQSFAHEMVRRGRPGLMQSFMNIATSHGLHNAGVGDAVNMLWKQAANETYRGLVDKLNPWRQAVEDLQAIAARNGVHVKLLAANDPYKLLRSVPAVYAAGHMDLIHGPTAYHGLDPVAPALAHALELALGSKYDVAKGGTADEFDAYLAARRLRNDYGPNSVTGAEPSHDFTKGYFDQIVSDAEAKHPTWEQAAHMIYEYNAAMWEKRHAAGFLTDKDFEDALTHNPDYVPLYRDVSDRGVRPGETGKSTKSAGGSRRRMNLGSEAYMSPVESMMQNAYELSALIAHNDALRALDGLAKIAGPDAGRIVERIPASVMSATKVGVDEILDSAGREIGVSRADRLLAKQTIATLFGDDAAGTVYRAKDAAEKGEPIVYLWDKGERIPLRLPDGAWGHNMIQAFAGMTPAMHGWAFELLALPARAQRMAIITHPAFLLTNTFKDQIDATLRTNVGYRPYVDQVRGVIHELSGDRVAQDYNRVGGAIGGMQSAEERTARLKADIRVLNSKGIAIRHFVSFKALAHAMELSETGTRLGLFERGEQKFSAEGMTGYEAAKEAAFEARDYMDFDRRGAWPFVQVLARLVPFMNASIQALDKTARVTGGFMQPNEVVERYFGGPPATREGQAKFDTAVKLWTGAVLLAAGSMAWRAANKDNPEYEEVQQYVRDTAWVVPISDTNYVAIPKPYEIGALSNAAERWYEAAAEHDPTALGKLAQGIFTNLMPPIDPAVAQVVWGLGTNQNSFGSPIVPDDQKNIPAQFQYNDRTSEFGKAVGRATAGLPGPLPQSPADVDFIVQTLGATFGREALNATNHARAPIGVNPADLPVFDRFVKDWTRGAVATKLFYSLMSGNSGEWQGAVAGVQKLVRDGETEKAAHFISGLDPERRAYVVLNLVGDGAMKDFHPMVRAQATSSAMQGLAFNLQQGNVKALEPGGAKVVDLTPAQRRDAVDALHKMAVSEQRNALIVSDIPGYAQAKPLPYDKFVHELRAASPELPIVLSERLAIGDPKLPSATDSYTVWKKLGPKLAAASPETIKAILDDKSIQGTAGLLRALEKPVPVQ